jgi:tripartite-type tricarboxylate transporter receptor subunit TctC
MKTIVHVAAGLAALMLAGASHAENAAPSGYPARQVRIVVPYPPADRPT